MNRGLVVVSLSFTFFVFTSGSSLMTASSLSTPTPCFQCKTTKYCINAFLKCDGMDDCGDYSDERNCSCGSSSFLCDNGRCIPPGWVCDKEDDCFDNSDERNCTDPCMYSGCSHSCKVIKTKNGTPLAQCHCNAGYHLRADGRTCFLDSCKDYGCSHTCRMGQTKAGTSFPQCGCNVGYYLRTDGKTCVDVDECMRKGLCKGGKCINTEGSYECRCRPGLQKGPDKNTCTDINECDGRHGCEHLCLNTYGSYTCACKKGYVRSYLNSKHCDDRDECIFGVPNCHVCHNVPGGYACECDPGFSQNANKTMCLDNDECSFNNGGCQQICHNSPGSYKCGCKAGFETLPNKLSSCTDINECNTNNGKGPCEYKCINKIGSFKCTCNVGYQLSSDGHTCEDIDECMNSNCEHLCVNTLGSHHCQCKNGYYLAKDRTSCGKTKDHSECGVVDDEITDTRDWKETSKSKWPWVVHFTTVMQGWFPYDADNWGVLGVILSERWILTAGHSLPKDGFYNAYTSDGASYDVEEIIPFSPCNPKMTRCKNDIALVKLRKLIKFSENVGPICIPSHSTQQSFLQNRSKPAMILTNVDPSGLKKRTVRIQRGRDCTHYRFSNHMICAGDLRGECAGDSGSPLVFSRKEINNVNHATKRSEKNIAYLSGVLSWGNDIIHETNSHIFDFENCNSDPQFLAYTNIATKLKWIKDKTGVTAYA